MGIVFLVVGLVVGFFATWFLQQYRFASQKTVPLQEVEVLKAQIKNLELESAQEGERIRNLERQLSLAQDALSEAQAEENDLKVKLAREETERQNSEKRIEEQRQQFEQIKEQLKIDFQNLANSIFDEKSEKFTKQNKENLDILLKPLSDKIKEFQEKVEKTHEDTRERNIELREQIKNLTELNVQMSEEANNLTNALKGQSKTMGNWGEFVLEMLLERSGLIKGEEYLVQESFATEDGRRSQPDIIINLPDNKHLVIDSKVSLVAYERFYSVQEGYEDTSRHLKEHIGSLKNHINNLTQKNYQELYQISSPDFVLMFVPLDAALITALQNEPNLFIEAFDKGVFLVSPATLLFALRTVANIWKREKQNKNAMEIARVSGGLYDKFVMFYEQLLKMGECLKRTQECYDDSISKLKTGKGSLVRRVEIIKKLGARTTKSLSDYGATDEETEDLNDSE